VEALGARACWIDTGIMIGGLDRPALADDGACGFRRPCTTCVSAPT
jgi:hypothetical protein